MLFRETADPETAAVLDRVTAGVAALVAELIAQDPGAQARDPWPIERREQGIAMIAQMIVGSAQSLANWWNDHQDVPRERLVQAAMELLWLGLDRLRAGEQLPAEGRGLNFTARRGRRAPTRRAPRSSRSARDGARTRAHLRRGRRPRRRAWPARWPRTACARATW